MPTWFVAGLLNTGLGDAYFGHSWLIPLDRYDLGGYEELLESLNDYANRGNLGIRLYNELLFPISSIENP